MNNKLPLHPPNLTTQNIDKIAALFPNCITEMLDEEKSTHDRKVYKRGINFELLKQMLSPDVVDGDEAYEFTWVGKKASIVEANKPIRKTLRPCPEESKNWDDTENLYIEGDNLEVLKLLQESYLGGQPQEIDSGARHLGCRRDVGRTCQHGRPDSASGCSPHTGGRTA